MSWRCHIFRKQLDEPGRFLYMIGEGFHDKTGLWGWSSEPVALADDYSKETLIEYIEQILKDIKEDGFVVRDHETGKIIEEEECTN